MIQNTNVSSIQPIRTLFEDEIADLWSDKKKEKQPVGFRVHPLIAIEHFLYERNALKLEHYPRYELFMDHFSNENDATYPLNPQLLNIRDVDVPDYEDLKSLVSETVEFWRTEFAMKSLNNVQLTEWETKVAEALTQMDKRQLHPDLLAIVCKLVPFYQSNMQIAKLGEIFKSANPDRDDLVIDAQGNVKLAHKERTITKNGNGGMAYFFGTEKGELVCVNVDRRDLQTAIDTILQLNNNKIKLDISIRPRTMYSNNFTYWVAPKIYGVSA
jgi:hypothetical protein